jgi:hypothetical protein
MRPVVLGPLLAGVCLAGFVPPGAAAGEPPAEPAAAIQALSEGLFLQKSVQAEQASVRVRAASDFSVELRPGVSDDDAGVALRINLPGRWSPAALREQLALAARSEELRVAELEWAELVAVYRGLATYRLLRKQIDLCAAELEGLEPFLGRADQGVLQRQLAVSDRAALYGHQLRLMNERQKLELAWNEIQLELHRSLGSRADLEALARLRPLAMPTRIELDGLVRQALEHRADYRRREVEAQALGAAEAQARAEDGFHLRFIQPSYARDYEAGEDTWALSAAFVLPWGGRNPDIAEYREQRELADFGLALQRRILKERLQSLIQASEALEKQIENRSLQIQPLVERLEMDLAQMDDGQLGSLRSRMQIRERMLDSALQTALLECRREQMAIDFAEELGTLQP